ncbi:MAG TPA: pirin-like C-terminal cupin domain-containing protein [Terriglobales bacterium]|nr:pirin-like C-terminal cupin domain-containing protein [Terriglobales bacterium]
MKPQRNIARVVTVPRLAPGFVGPGHLTAAVVSPEDFVLNDPFIVLMDDRLEIGDRTVGEPHPHAGFETVTLILDGAIYDRDEGGVIKAGEAQWMTAGRGIIHGENVMTKGKVRLLQLWLTLPKHQRWTTPGFQTIHADAVPVRREAGVEVRIYSGASGSLHSTTRNHVPVTMTEITMDPQRSVDQELPTSYNGFAYLINGSVQVGGAVLKRGQVGWLDRPLDRPNDEDTSVLHVVSGNEGARLVLYAGQPQGDTIVSHGPFIGDTKEDIVRLFSEYRAGEFVRMTDLARQDG